MSSFMEKFEIASNIPQNVKTEIKSFYVFNSTNDNNIFDNNIIFITKEDIVYGMGPNTHGVLGLGHNKPVTEYTEITELSHKMITSLNSGYKHVLAMNDENQLYIWGSNERGQLGNWYNNVVEFFKPENIAFFKNKPVEDICCGAWHNMVLSCGLLYGWGNNDYHQLDKIVEKRIPRPTKLLTSEFKNYTFKYIYCQNWHSFAITTDGLLYSWGKGSTGILGNTTKDNICNPYKISLLNVKKISSTLSGQNSYFLTNEGYIYYCGLSTNGEIQTTPTIMNENDVIFQDISYGYSPSIIGNDSDGLFYIFQKEQIVMLSASDGSSIDEICAKHFKVTSHLVEILDQGEIKESYAEEIATSTCTINEGFPSFLFNKNFKFLGVLGSGGFGKVAKYQNIQDEQVYAIKMIDIAGHQYDNEMLNEVKIIAKIHSQYVARYHNSLRIKNFLFIQLELCSNNLKNILVIKPSTFGRESNEAMNSIEYYISCEIFRQITEALNYLHSLKPKPIIHRDLKPENILVGHFGGDIICKMADFGLSKFISNFSNCTASHTKGIGTERYMAKEVYSGKYDIKADIYSLGLIGREVFDYKYDSLNFRYENSTILERVLKCEHTLTDMISAVAHRRPSCSDILSDIKNWCMDNSIKTDSEYTNMLDKFEKNRFDYFYSILKNVKENE